MKKRWIFLIIFGGFLLDILSKILVRNFLPYGVPKPILGNFLRFTYVENSGVIFGLGHGLWQNHIILKNVLLFVFAIIVLVTLIYEYRRTQSRFVKVLYLFIITGALGNVLERIFGYLYYEGHFRLFYGRVVDFIDIGFGTHRWFYFNFADSYISVSVFLLMIYFFFFQRTKTKKSPL